MLAGSLEIQLLAEIGRLSSDLQRAQSLTQSAMSKIESAANSAMKALGAIGAGLSVAAFANMVKGAIDAADHLNKLTQRTGVATEALSQLQYAAKLADVSSDSLATGLKKLNVSIAGGLAGEKEKVAQFKALGITLTTTSGQAKTADQVLLEMADTFSKSKDGAGKTAAAVALLGKAGDEMIPLLNAGGEGIRAMMQEANKLGLTIGSDFARRAEEFNDNLTKVKTSGERLGIVLGESLVKSLGLAMKAFADATVEGGKLAGVIAFVQTLLTGDDRHKANKAMVELAEQILQQENFITKVKAKGEMQTAQDAAALKQSQARLAALRQEYEMHRNYAKQLDEQQAKADAAAKGPPKSEIKPPAAGGEKIDAMAKAYGNLMQKVSEFNAVRQMELTQETALTEGQKMALDVMESLRNGTLKFTDAQKISLTAALEQALASESASNARKAEIKATAELVAARKALRDEDLKSVETYEKTVSGQADNNQKLREEIELIGKSAEARSVIERARIQSIITIKEQELATLELEASETGHMSRRLIALQEEIRLLNERAGLLGTKAIEETNAKAAEEAAQSWKQVSDAFVDNLMRGGKSVAQYLKDLFRTMVLRPILQPIGNAIGGYVSGIMNTGAAQGGASAFLSGAGGGMFATGGASPFLGAGYAATMQNGLISGFSTNMANIATLMEGGSYMTAFSASMPYLTAFAVAASVISKLFDGGGGPKTEGGYAPGGLNIAGLDIGGNMQGSQRGDIATAKGISETISATYAEIAKTLGLKDGKLEVGVFFAKDPEGDSLTQLQVVTDAYNRSERIGGIENVARGDDALKAAIGEETLRAIIEALKTSDLSEQYKEWLNALAGDASTEEMQAALDRVTKAGTERANLEAQIFDLTATEIEKLNKVRDAERAAVDESNQALLEQVYALQDQKSAVDESNNYIAEMGRAWEEASKSAADSLAFAGDVMSRLSNSFKELIGNIRQEVERIRGLWIDNTPGGLEGARAAFFESARVAASGGKGAMAAAEELPALARQLLSIAQTQAGSFYELRALQALTAQTLSDTIDPLRAFQREQTSQVAQGLGYSVSSGGGSHSLQEEMASDLRTMRVMQLDMVTSLQSVKGTLKKLDAIGIKDRGA